MHLIFRKGDSSKYKTAMLQSIATIGEVHDDSSGLESFVSLLKKAVMKGFLVRVLQTRETPWKSEELHQLKEIV